MSRKRVKRRSNRSKMSLLVGTIITLLVVTIGIALLTNYIQSANEKKLEVSAEINSEVIENDVSLENEQKENYIFHSDLTFPITNHASIDEDIEEWVRSIENNFQEKVDKLKVRKNENAAKLEINTDVVASDNDIYQFILKEESSINKDEEKDIRTWIVHVDDGNVLSFNELFNQDHLLSSDDFTEYLSDNLLEKLTNNENLAFSIDGSNIVFYEVIDQDVQATEVPIMEFYEQVNVKYEDAILSEDVKNEIAELKAEEEAKKAEEEAKQEQEEKNELEDKKYIALTFDDGPASDSTERILQTLDEYDAKATFFMLGENAANLPQIAKKVADAGHEIANHSISHPDLAQMSLDSIREQLTKSKQQIEDATGKSPIYFRPPYGSYNDNVMEIARETNQKVMLWSVDTRDWESRNPASINEVVRTYTRPGAILLMHDIHGTTADALPEMLEYLSNEGYEFVTLSELLPYIDGEGVGPYTGN